MKAWKAPCTTAALFVLVFFFSPRLTAQAAPGVFADANHPAGAPDPEKLDEIWQVDPINGSVSVKTPFSTTPQGGRGPKFPFSLSYNSTSTTTLQATGGYSLPGIGWWIGISSPGQTYGVMSWSPTPVSSKAPTGPTGPWTTTGPFMYSSSNVIPDMNNVQVCPGNGSQCFTQNFGYGCEIDGPFLFTDENGASHEMNLETFSSNYSYNSLMPPCQDGYNADQTYGTSSYTSDGSAMQTSRSSVVYPDGTVGSGSNLTDANGNSAHLSSNSGVISAIDALGRTAYSTNIPIGAPGQIPTGSYYVKTTGAAGNTQTYTVTFSSQTLGSFSMPHPNASSEIITNFYCIASINCPTGYSVQQPKSGAHFSAVSSIARPDGTSYTFDYDPVYGTVSKVTFPTGGYVRFQYAVLPVAATFYGQFDSVSDIVVTDVYTSTGSGDENHWSYNIAQATSGPPTSTVYAPDGSYTEYTGACFIYSIVPLYKQGAKPTCKEQSRAIYSSSGQLLKTVAENFAIDGLPKQIATSLYDGPHPMQQLVQNSYDSYDNVIEKDESDFYTCSSNPCPDPTKGTLSAPSAGWKRITYTNYAYSTNSALATAHRQQAISGAHDQWERQPREAEQLHVRQPRQPHL